MLLGWLTWARITIRHRDSSPAIVDLLLNTVSLWLPVSFRVRVFTHLKLFTALFFSLEFQKQPSLPFTVSYTTLYFSRVCCQVWARLTFTRPSAYAVDNFVVIGRLLTRLIFSLNCCCVSAVIALFVKWRANEIETQRKLLSTLFKIIDSVLVIHEYGNWQLGNAITLWATHKN